MATVKIESLIKRANGSRIQIGDKTYHFRPSESHGPHVATVDEDHAKVLLSKPHAFKLHKDATEKALPPPPAPTQDEKQPAQPAGEESKQAASTAQGDDKPPTQAELEAHDKAVEAYKAKFHKRPHHSWTTEVILAKLAEG